MNTPIQCANCRHSYDGADSILRCRPIQSYYDNECTERRAAACRRFEREPGADAEESPCAWFWAE